MLRAYRVAAGLSQERVAEEARLSVETIGALERGLRQAPYRHTVRRIIAALRLSKTQASALEAAAETARRRTPKSNEDGAAGIDPLVGRTIDVENIARLLAANRLVTITGTAGVGKTRVADRVAPDVRGAFGPATFVDLANASTAFMVCDAIASALGNLSVVDHHDPETMARALAERSVLIVLDTCEHLIPDIATVVLALLRICPRVRMLVTSRQRLAISGEAVYRLPPLALPAAAVADIEEAQRYAAIELFVRRAVSAERTLSFTAGSAETLAAICRALDGIPLSIELAAARAGTLGLQTLAARLREGFELTNINRDVPPRHRSSQASIEWSYRLLTRNEQKAFTQLAVFAEPFTLDECERMCISGGLDEIGIPDILSGLVEKGLIEVDTTGTALQYRMFNTMRRFAARLSHSPPTGAPPLPS